MARCIIGRFEYDLTLADTAAIRDFVSGLDKFSKETKNKAVQKLLADKKIVRTSDVLRAVNGEETPNYTNVEDMNLFHSCITAPMINGGWFTEFPAFLLNARGIPMLRLDIIKYVLTNWNWISSIYNPSIFTIFAEIYGSIPLVDSAIEENAIRRQYIRMALELDAKSDEAIGRYITNDEIHSFFSKTDNTHNADEAHDFEGFPLDQALAQLTQLYLKHDGIMTHALIQRELRLGYVRAEALLKEYWKVCRSDDAKRILKQLGAAQDK